VQNAIAWFEIPVIDFDRARKFYETIFGATFQVLKLGQGPTLALSRSTSLGAWAALWPRAEATAPLSRLLTRTACRRA